MSASYPLTLIGTGYPLQRCDIIVMLANREGEDTNLNGETDRTVEANHLKEI